MDSAYEWQTPSSPWPDTFTPTMDEGEDVVLSDGAAMDIILPDGTVISGGSIVTPSLGGMIGAPPVQPSKSRDWTWLVFTIAFVMLLSSPSPGGASR